MTNLQKSTLDHLFDSLLFDASESLFKALYPSHDRKVWEPVHIAICDNGVPLEPIGGVFDRRDLELPNIIAEIEATFDLQGLTLEIWGTEL